MNHRTCFPCTILPEFTILDDKGLDEKLKEICDKAKAEPGCLFFGFARNSNKLVGREAYVDGSAVHEHLANVGKDIEALVEDGILEMETMTMHGPAKELEVIQERQLPLRFKGKVPAVHVSFTHRYTPPKYLFGILL